MEAGQDDTDDKMDINIEWIDDTRNNFSIEVKSDDTIHDSILNNPKEDIRGIIDVFFGDDIMIQSGDTFEDYGIEAGARLLIRNRQRATFEEVVRDVIELNPDIQGIKRLRNHIKKKKNPDEPWHIKGNLNWADLGIRKLPESFGDLTLEGDLWLYSNQLMSLPESFGNLTVGGELRLADNQLVSLPESFGDLTVGGDLFLNNNQLNTLPESFGNLTVGGKLSLADNQLVSLPESFGDLTVGRDLFLNSNQLTSLPESFGNITVGGDLWLIRNNQLNLTSLPESFTNVGGSVFKRLRGTGLS
jgi:hypothetical protein